MSRMTRILSLAGVATLAMLLAAAEASANKHHPVNVQQAAGPNAAAIQSAVDAYRAGLGTLNANNPGSVGSGRREINWDGVPARPILAECLPAGLLQREHGGRARGVVFDTHGSGFQVSSSAGVAPIEFDNINPTYSSLFTTFSPPKLFTAIHSKFVDVRFFVPGSSTPATTSGFGSVFTDVDRKRRTQIKYFDERNRPLGKFDVPASPGNETLSFLGVRFLDDQVAAGKDQERQPRSGAKRESRAGPRRDGRLHLRRTHAVTADEEASQREPGCDLGEIARTFDCDIAYAVSLGGVLLSMQSG